MIRTVKQACRFNPVIQDYRMSAGIENLADLIKDQGDGRDFFSRNFVTHGMGQLFREGMLRLSGKSDQAVFELTQAMGGGKTHMMIALGLLARHPHLRSEVLPGDLNDRVGFGDARIAAFNGHNNPDNYIWGEIAAQLGASEAIKDHWVNGPKAVDQRKWKKIIGEQPTLILLDELPPYLRNAGTQMYGQGTLADMVVYSLSSLMNAALELPNCAIVIANLSGSYKAQTKALAESISNLQQETRRQTMTITPVQLAGRAHGDGKDLGGGAQLAGPAPGRALVAVWHDGHEHRRHQRWQQRLAAGAASRPGRYRTERSAATPWAAGNGQAHRPADLGSVWRQ